MNAQNQHILGNRYQLIKELNRGAMGIVYETNDLFTGQKVAVKVLNISENDPGSISSSSYSNMKLSLINEFQILSRLRHPNIVSVYDYGLFEDNPYIVMELLKSTDTFDIAVKNLTADEIIKIIMQILEGLIYLHRNEIIHRDLKPSNVIAATGQVKILDFGLSVISQNVRGRAGTLDYMSPETISKSMTIPQSDLYAVGLLAYQALTGHLPFRPGDIMSIISTPVDMTDLEYHPISHVIERLLQKDPEDRYETSYQTLNAISDVTGIPVIGNISVRESLLQASKFIGRENELQVLNTALVHAVAGKGSLWWLAGESGIGKSRLLAEFRSHALVKGVIVLQGQQSDGQNFLYQCWRNVLSSLILNIELTISEASILKEIIPNIDDLLQREIPLPSRLKPEGHLQRLLNTIATILKRHTRPILIILEDMHWAQESLLVLKHLTQVIEDNPWLIVASYRTDDNTSMLYDIEKKNHIALQRLGIEDIATLSQSILGKRQTTPEVVEFLHKETEGNPLFIIEVMRELVKDSRRLESLEDVALPKHIMTEGIIQLLRGHLNCIEDQQKLKWSAIIGSYLDVDLLDYLSLTSGHPTEQKAQEFITNARVCHIVEIYGNRWRFSHDKLRELVLADLKDAERRVLYQQVADAIEHVYLDMLDDHMDMLLTCWQFADNPGKVLLYLQKVIRRHLKFGNTSIAGKLLHESETWLERANHNQQVTYKSGLYLQMAEWYASQADWKIAIGYYQRARQEADKIITIDSMVGETRCLIRLSHYEQASAILEPALEQSIACDYQHGKTQCLQQLGQSTLYQGDFEKSQQYFEQALTINTQLDNLYHKTDNLTSLGLIKHFQGFYDEAKRLYEESLLILKEIGDQHGISRTLLNLSVLLRFKGDYRNAEIYCEQSLLLLDDIGDSYLIALCISNLTNIKILQRQFKKATELCHKVLEMQQQLGFQYGIAWCFNNFGLIAYYQANFAVAIKQFEESLKIRRQIHDKEGIGTSLNYLSWIALEQDKIDDARSYLQSALSIASETNTKPLQLDCVATFSYLAYREHDSEFAATLFHLVLNHPVSTPEAKDFLLNHQALRDSSSNRANFELSSEYSLETIIQQLSSKLES